MPLDVYSLLAYLMSDSKLLLSSIKRQHLRLAQTLALQSGPSMATVWGNGGAARKVSHITQAYNPAAQSSESSALELLARLNN